jgi:putative transposase
VHIAGCTPTPSAQWVTQQARQVTWSLGERPESFRSLIRDRDQKFSSNFAEVFRSEGCEVIRTPFRAPQANGVAERFVRTVESSYRVVRRHPESAKSPAVTDGRPRPQ